MTSCKDERTRDGSEVNGLYVNNLWFVFCRMIVGVGRPLGNLGHQEWVNQAHVEQLGGTRLLSRIQERLNPKLLTRSLDRKRGKMFVEMCKGDKTEERTV